MDGSPVPPDRWRRAALGVISNPLLDIAVIVIVTFVFAWPVLNFDERHVPAGEDDWQDLTSSMQLARDSILDHHELPLWDPYFGTGTPYLAEPKTYVFNPVATIPALMFGVYNGPKVAAALSMVLAGAGLYFFAGLLGCSRPWRLWAGLLMAMSGAIAGRVYAGHFQFVLALGFLPWAFALSYQALRRKGVIFPMLAALANAGLFFSGHAIPTVFATPGLLIVFAFVAVDEARRAGPGRREVALFNVTGRGLQVAGWTFGLVAVQLLPMLESLSYFSQPSYDLSGAQSIVASAHNFSISDLKQAGPYPGDAAWGWWEYYSYVGIVPLLSFALLPFAMVARRQRFGLLLVTTLFGFYLLWTAAPDTPFRWIYDIAPRMHQLRAPSRALMFATPFLILLSACSLDHVSRWLRTRKDTFKLRLSAAPATVGIGTLLSVIILATCFVALFDVFDANRNVIGGRTRFPTDTSVARTLRELDNEVFYVEASNLGQAVPPEFYKQGIKRIDASWEYRYYAPHAKGDNGPPIPITPRYHIASREDAPPSESEVVFLTNDLTVYEQHGAPSYATTLRADDLPEDPEFKWAAQSTPAEARIVSANVIEVRAAPRAKQDRLLVLESFHPGWRVEVDGKRVGRAGNFGGFLSMPAREGEHTYVFVFDPRSARFGGAFTIGTLLGAALLLGSRFAQHQRKTRAN